MLARYPAVDSSAGGSQNGDCISVEKRSVKATKAVEQHQLSHRSLGREEQRRSWQETARLPKCTGQNVEGTEGAVGKDESQKQKCMTEN